MHFTHQKFRLTLSILEIELYHVCLCYQLIQKNINKFGKEFNNVIPKSKDQTWIIKFLEMSFFRLFGCKNLIYQELYL